MNERIGKLLEIGQSIWLDNLSRRMMDSGELRRMIEQDGVRGITSNPTIFQKAISGSRDYDAALRSLLQKGIREEKKLFLQLAMEDVSRAADMLAPVYDKSGGEDGFVSIEVSPDLAYDTEKTIDEAKLLFSTIGKKNILNNFCIGISSNEESCNKCHAGYNWTDAKFDFTDSENVDCLACHDNTNTYVKSEHGYPDATENLTTLAQHVGRIERFQTRECQIDFLHGCSGEPNRQVGKPCLQFVGKISGNLCGCGHSHGFACDLSAIVH